MSDVYIGLGSNLDDPEMQVKSALEHVKGIPQTQLTLTASLYGSCPMGPKSQPDYINTVIMINTDLLPQVLLSHLQKIELDQGRIRKSERWGPRVIDLDILLFDDIELNSETLTIPHYGMRQREFVLYPLYEIAPALVFPDGTPLTTLVKACPRNGLNKLN
jgi:2-amino-4-hydroxy-6-hydroxymethyldihydropteridine diphosphokinase